MVVINDSICVGVFINTLLFILSIWSIVVDIEVLVVLSLLPLDLLCRLWNLLCRTYL